MTRRARVVQLIPDLGVGGAERMMASLSARLDRDRFEVKVVSFFDRSGSPVEEDLARDGIEVLTLGKNLGFDPRMFRRIADVFRGLRPDIVHSHRPVYPYALASVLGRLRGRVIHTVHNVADKEVQYRLRKSAHWLAFRAGVAPVAICDFVARTIEERYGVQPRATIPNGIPVEAFTPSPSAGARWRAEHGVRPSTVMLASLARLAPQKNLAAAIDAIAALDPELDVLLVLAGDGPEREPLERKVEALRVRHRVRLLGQRRDTADILHAADVFVLPSSFEGHPLSVMEAMAAGKPVLATSVGGVPELVRDGETGLLVRPGDVQALSAAVRTLALDPALRARMGSASLLTATRSFDVSIMVERYERLYDEVLAEASASRPAPAARVLRPAPRARPREEGRPRVVQFIPDLGVGGAERMMLSLATGLDRGRYDVRVLTYYDRADTAIEHALDDAGIEVVTLGKRLGFDPRMFRRVAAALRELDPDIVHSHRPVFPYALPSVRASRRRAFVHTVHSVAQHEVNAGLRRTSHWLAFRAGVVPVAICDYVARTFVEIYGLSPRAVIPNGVQVRAFELPADVRRRWREAEGIPEEAVVFAAVARLAPAKSPLALLEAFASVSRRREALLVLAGDGPLRSEVEERVQALGLGGRVRLLGARTDVPEILAAADAFVLASAWEGYPLSVLEAMAAGRAVVSTAVGGVPEMLRAGETGLLVPPGDVPALADALDALARDASLRDRLGANARRIAAGSFDVSRMIDAYDRLYQEVLGARARAASSLRSA